MAAANLTTMPVDIDTFVALGRVGEVVLAPDGRTVVAAVARPADHGGSFQSSLQQLSVDAPSAAPVQRVAATHDARSPAFLADGRLVFLGKVKLDGPGDHKLDQVLLAGAPGESPVALTDAPRGVSALKAGGDRLAWLEDRIPGLPDDQQRAAWLAEQKTGKGPRHFTRQSVRFWKRWLGLGAPRFFTARADGSQVRCLTPDAVRQHVEAEWDLSADGRRLVTTRARQGERRLEERDLVVFDLDAGQQLVLGTEAGVRWSRPRLSADGRRLAALRHVQALGSLGREELWCWTLGPSLDPPGPPTRLAADWDRWAEPVGWHGDSLLLTARDQGRQPAWRIAPGQPAPTPLSDAGVFEGHQVTDTHLVGVHHDLATPPAPALLPLTGGPLRRLGDLAGAGPDLSRRVHSRWLHAPGKDGDQVPWLYVRPADQPDDAPLPTILWVHGGPVSHWADWWHWRWNPLLFASHGYALLLPNPRGSTGYGQAWIEGVWNNRWGEACVDDVLAVVDHACDLPGVDADRLGAMGGSFGGWMVNRLGGLVDRWRCIVSHAGIFDHGSFSASTDMPPYWYWEHGGTPFDDPDHERWSPHHLVSEWRAPTLVVHGELDYRVPIEQGLALFEALLHHGVHAELLAFPDEGHWIEKPANIAAWHHHVLRFLSDWLGGAPPRALSTPLPPSW